MFRNLAQLRLQLERENLLEVNPRTYFKEYTFCEPDTYRRDLLENLDTLEAVIHRAVITCARLQLQSQDVLINLVQAVDDSLIVSKSSWIESENNHALGKLVNETQLPNRGLVMRVQTLEANLNTDVKSWMLGSFAKPSILGKPVLQPHRNQSVVRQPNAFKSERPNFSKPRFAAQVDVNNVLSKPVTPHYLPKVREYVLAKPHHVIAPGSFRNSQEEPYGSNDMAHNHYLEEARKKTQERNRNSKPSVMHTTSLQNTTNGSKPNPRSNNQISRSLHVSKSSCGMSNGVSLVDHSRNSSSFSDSKHFVCSTCHKCVFNANHDDCIKKFLKEVNSRAKVQSPKTRNNNKLVEPKSHTQKPSRQIAIGQRFSPKKSSAVHEKPNTPRSCLRWKPTGRIFKIAGLRWIPTGKMFTDNTTKVDREPLNGSNDDITNPYECDQTLNVSAGTLNLSADDVWTKQFKPRSSLSDDVWTKQFKPRSSSNDVWTKQFKPRSSSKDVWTKQFKPRSSSKDVWAKQFRPRLVLHLDVAWTKQFKPRSSSKDVCSHQFKPRSSSNDVWTKQFKPRSSSNDVWTKQFKPRSSSNDVWTKQFKPRSSSNDVWTK
ncbi:hypothetical protein Tco_0641782 [Tanacetum coccineum]